MPGARLEAQSANGVTLVMQGSSQADGMILDVPAKANPNNFSVYVGGLSNGLAKKETLDKEKGETRVQVSKKTLRLDFRRPVATAANRADDIKVNDNNGLGAEEWIYRESSVSTQKANPDGK